MDFWFRLPVRTRLGVIATVLLVAAGVLTYLILSDPVHYNPRKGGVIKYAPILFLLWLAWRDLQNIPIWVYLIAPPILILCVLKPAAWLIVIPVALFALFIMPKKDISKKESPKKRIK